ncbi:Unknown protein [Striga hermonthica]|uniref:Uncharacterized protein n=1 Tax=Striga hermonthica TaxID=68872 RepID=A0A9N7RQJ2_STRHE|nr:Unknown protein [Striga hermonthica]
MKFKPPPKRKKVDPELSSSTSHGESIVNLPSGNRDEGTRKEAVVHETRMSEALLKIQQARNYAVAQAQQDCCAGNFRIFDSPFGNYLVPVIPSRSELGG